MTGLQLALSQQLLPVAATALAVGMLSCLYFLPKSPTPTTITVDPLVGHGSCLGVLLLGYTKHWIHQCTGFHQQAEAPDRRTGFLPCSALWHKYKSLGFRGVPGLVEKER